MGPTPSALEKQMETLSNNGDKFFGFANKNNICYVNSVMQCLYSLRLFRKKMLAIKQINDEESMLKAVNELFLMIDTKKKRSGVIDAKKFVLQIKKNNQEFNNEEHHDAHEFLMWLLDSLNENVKVELSKYRSSIEPVSIFF